MSAALARQSAARPADRPAGDEDIARPDVEDHLVGPAAASRPLILEQIVREPAEGDHAVRMLPVR
ncbi:hypothetical protein ACU61A_21835 [Pseudonocardia sichuanensis]